MSDPQGFPAPSPRLPAFPPARLRGVTAIDREQLVLGVSFDTADGQTARLLLRTQDVADLVLATLGMKAFADDQG